jgi:hypothetical protein
MVMAFSSMAARLDLKRSTTYAPHSHLLAEAMLISLSALKALPTLPLASLPVPSPISQ